MDPATLARKTVAQSLAPSADEVDHYVAYMQTLCAADEAEQDCAQAIQRAKATTNLLERASFVALQEPPRSESGGSAWHPSHSLVLVKGGAR